MEHKPWTRAELKERGKANFKRSYWAAVLVCLILAIISNFGSSSSGSGNSGGVTITPDNVTNTTTESTDNSLTTEQQKNLAKQFGSIFNVIPHATSGTSWDIFRNIAGTIGNFAIGSVVTAIVIAIAISGFLFTIFFTRPLEVGGCHFYTIPDGTKRSVGDIMYAFKCGSYLNVVKIQFLRDVKIFLWTCLLIVPGIIKSFEYRMVPYILAENPGISSADAFAKSREMMMGEKMNSFILDLSFILWAILDTLTMGLLGIFYLNPYIQATNAELYKFLRDEGTPAVSSGTAV